MNSPTTTKQGSEQRGTEQRGTEQRGTDTGQGRITIADSVVQKIVGMATREVAGVYQLGTGTARAIGAIKERVPGSSGVSRTQGVTVEVGEKQTAIDLDVVTEYGVSIPDLAQGIRRNVISSVERMTGLEVAELNISVDDVHVPGDESEDEGKEPRVQ